MRTAADQAYERVAEPIDRSGQDRRPGPYLSLSQRAVNAAGTVGIVDIHMDKDNEIVKRVTWSLMLTASGALATMIAARLTAVAYRRIFNEDPPE